MALEHTFELLDRETDAERRSDDYYRDPRAIRLHDDVMDYLWHTLTSIPTKSPSRRKPLPETVGLHRYGPTIIDVDGAAVAGPLFADWADRMAQEPPNVTLPGALEPATFDRDALVATLRQIAAWCETVRDGGGRWYLYHQGI